MGRLIDIDVLFDYFGNDAIDETTRSNIEYFVSEKGTVEAIPKSDYENRLKEDLVAVLEDLRLDFQEAELAGVLDNKELIFADEADDLIQQKIKALKGESDNEDNN